MFTPTPTHTSGFAAFATRMGRAVWNALVSIHRRRRNRLAVKQLMGWNDHMLRDIGLTRADVRCALRDHRKMEASGRLRILAVERRATARAQARKTLEIAAIDGQPTGRFDPARTTCGA